MDFFDNFDAHHGSGLYSSISTGTGLNTIMHDGMAVDTLTDLGTHVGDFTMPNVDGGLDVYEGGQLVSHSVPNVMGGNTVYEGTLVEKFSIAGIDGQSDYYDSDMNHLGYTMDNVFGGEDLMVTEAGANHSMDPAHADFSADSAHTDYSVDPAHTDFFGNSGHTDYSLDSVNTDFPSDSGHSDFTYDPGNVNDILNTQDPLRYSHELMLPDFKI